MPLLRTYDAERNTITVTVRDAYRDRLSHNTDIKEYLPFLHEEAAKRDHPVVVELGTRAGNSTLAFLAAGAEVWSVDIEDIRLNPDGMMPWRNLPEWHFIQGDSLNVQADVPEEIDIFFNDASHEYQPTLEECWAYVPKVRPGGVALFHDTRLLIWKENGVPWYGRDMKDEFPPVRKALDDYCAETGLTWEEIPGDYGLGVIRC